MTNSSLHVGTSPGASDLLLVPELSLQAHTVVLRADALTLPVQAACVPAFACVMSAPAVGTTRSVCLPTPLWIDGAGLTWTSPVVAYGLWSANDLVAVDSHGAAVAVPSLAELALASGVIS